ncbi:MAG: HAD family phosphatase [Thermoplasmata archaeon]
MAEAVIFDLDGILVDTEHYKFKAWQEAFRTLGVEITWEEFRQEFVVQGSTIVEFLERRNYKEEFIEDDVRPVANRYFLRSIGEEVPSMPGAVEVLDRLHGDFVLGLASNSYWLYVDKLLEKFGMKRYFKGIANGSEVENLKPHPEVLLLAAERMGVDPEVCVVIEDAPKGIVAAKNAGMKGIAIPTEDTETGDFSQADLVLKSLNDVTVELVRNL